MSNPSISVTNCGSALSFPSTLRLRYGVFTPSEIGAFAVIYAVCVGFFAYRMLTLRSCREAVEGSLIDVGGVMFLLALSAPIFLPLVTKYGIDPVHFGLVFIIAATIGNYTPPVGAAMFVACQVLRCPIGEYTRESAPFLIAVSIVTLLLIFVPGVVLFVPDLIFGKD